MRKGVYLYSTTPHKARTLNVKQKFPEITRINTLIINFNSKRGNFFSEAPEEGRVLKIVTNQNYY